MKKQFHNSNIRVTREWSNVSMWHSESSLYYVPGFKLGRAVHVFDLSMLGNLVFLS